MCKRPGCSFLSAFLLLLTGVSAGQVVQFAPCKFGKAVLVGRAEGISVMRISIVEASGEIGASVFVPDGEAPLPGILFTHSAIRGSNVQTSLLRFAQGMARAGAASVVIDGDLQWEQPNDNNNRSPHVLACAGQWLLQHVSLDSARLVVAGPSHWGGGDTPWCLPGERPCWHPHGWINFGQASPAELVNTDRMLTAKGQWELAQHASKWIKLRTLKPELFAVSTTGGE